jgi:hypothetical protein
MSVFDTTFNYKTDEPAKTKPDADRDSPRLRADHELLWSKKLKSGVLFAPSVSAARSNEYLIFTDTSGDRYCYGSDAITNSYTTWLRPRPLVDAIALLDDDERSRYLDPPYTIGSAMIWPVKSNNGPSINQARVWGRIGDRMDLTLECIRRHYAKEPWSPLVNVINAYRGFFELFEDFKEFVDFFHLQDLVTDDYGTIRFYLHLDDFKRHATPATRDEYVQYREAVLAFIEKRSHRMAKWVTKHHRDIEVRQ